MSNSKLRKPLPPGQSPIKRLLRWGKDHPTIGVPVPEINLQTYRLTIDGEVENPQRLDWNQIKRLPRIESVSDFHCVEGWSVLDLKWEGIQFKTVIDLAKPKPEAKHVTFECADGYTTSLSMNELAGNDVLLAYRLSGQPLEPGHGFPLRLIVPDKYAYKSALWLTRIRFTIEKELGYWEKRGYSDTADIWKNDRYTR